jgi:hypothetical protein
MSYTGLSRTLLGAGVLALSFSTLCPAQLSTDTTRYSVIQNIVKPEMLTEYLEIQKNEVNPLIKKAGITQRTVLVNALGNTYEYTSITPMPSYSMLDADSAVSKALASPEGVKVLARLRRCIMTSRTYTIVRVNDLSLPPDTKNPPVASVSTRVRLLPGKAQEYEAFVKSDLLPILKKAKAEGKIAGYVVSRRQLGVAGNERTATVYLNKFADLDAGPAVTQMMGAEASAKLAAKHATLTSPVETLVRRRVADLSF